MQFSSPRFAGDPVLEEILADPDTGTKKLQKGSPKNSVIPVQQALFDLGWSGRIEPPERDAQRFVDGDYGPVTTRTVLKYKEHYDIHFPPLAPTGSFDGFAGPRTLARLDKHCVLLDEAAAAIASKARESAPNERYYGATPILGTTGASAISAGGESPVLPSGIWYKRGIGAFLVALPFFPTYAHHGGESGVLGFPTSDAFPDGANVFRQNFEFGFLLAHDGVIDLTETPVPDEIEIHSGF